MGGRIQAWTNAAKAALGKPGCLGAGASGLGPRLPEAALGKPRRFNGGATRLGPMLPIGSIGQAWVLGVDASRLANAAYSSFGKPRCLK